MRKNNCFTTHKISALMLAMFSTMSVADTPFDIKLSYYDTSSNANARKAGIEANIRHFAEALYEATNGAHRLRNVTIYADGAFKDDTDILWVQKCWPNANISGRNTKGSRIEHCDNFNDSQDYIGKNTMWGGYTLMHEWGHFTYGMFDEYQNTDKACQADNPGGPCKDDTPVPNSLMNNQDKAGNADNVIQDLSWLNFSTAKNNTKNTAQHRIYGLSGWETLVRNSDQDSESAVSNANGVRRTFYPDLVAAAPAVGQDPSIEINTEENRTKAKSLLNIIWKTGDATPVAKSLFPRANTGASNLTLAKQIIIERSSNISAATLEEVKAASQQIVEQANIGDTLGIIVFDATAKELVAPTTIVSEATKTLLLTALQSIQPSTQPAALGDALKAALTSLKSANLPANSVSSMYLFADGFSPSDTVKPLSLIDSLQKEGIAIFSFGLSNDLAVNTLLRQLGEKTRGDYYFAVKSSALIKGIQQAEERISPSADAIIASDEVAISNAQELPFYVDSTLGSVELVLSYSGAPTTASFTVIDPTGKSTAVAQSSCVTEAAAEPNNQSNYCSLKLSGASEGNWKIKMASTNSAPLNVFYSVSGEPKDNNAAITAAANATDGIVAKGSQVVLTAKVEQEFPITDLTVSGKLLKPDGTSTSLNWVDDGSKPDRKARDGIYSATFVTSDEGEYSAAISFDNQANKGQFTNTGATYAVTPGANAGPGDTFSAVNVKFTRVASTDILATQLLPGTATLSDFERVMNWGEAVVAPKLLVVKGKQSMNLAPYNVRYYPQTKTYLGFNPTDGNLYIYNTEIYGSNVVLLGPLAGYLSNAKQDGF